MKIAGLLLLSAIPVIAGALRVIDLSGGAHPDPETSARFAADPIPVLAHILGATVFSLVGAFQFSDRLRRHAWHRRAGRVVFAAGLVAAASGVWMAFSSTVDDGGLLFALRLVFGSAMAASLVLGFLAIRRRALVVHRAWMTRAYAIGVGAGTQALVGIAALAQIGTPSPVGNSLLMGLAWVINLSVAEFVIRRSARRSPSSARSPRIGAPRPPRPVGTSGR